MEAAARAAERWEAPAPRGAFLPRPEAERAAREAGRLAGVVAWACGGCAGAGRARVVAGRDELLAGLELPGPKPGPEPPAGACECPGASGCLACGFLEVRGNFAWAPKTSHRDFLGAVLGCGLERDVIGDLFLLRGGCGPGEEEEPEATLEGAHIVVVPELMPFLEAELTQVARVPVRARCILREALRVSEPRRRVRCCVVPSLRLDAVLAAGFGVSRARAAEAVRRGAVQVNWVIEGRPAAAVAPGDVLSFRGQGRIEVGEGEPTSKGRISVKLAQLL